MTWKAHHAQRYVSREEVLHALIAHGWIDGPRLKLDDVRTMQLISPRKQQAWADSHKRRAASADAAGKRPMGVLLRVFLSLTGLCSDAPMVPDAIARVFTCGTRASA